MSPSHDTSSHSVLPALHHAFSGSLGTLVSTCTLYPLSLVIARLQVQSQLRREGRLAPAQSSAPAPAPPAHAPASTARTTTARASTPPPSGKHLAPEEHQHPGERLTPEEQSTLREQLPLGDHDERRDPVEQGIHDQTNRVSQASPRPAQEQDRQKQNPSPQRPSEYAGILDAFSQIWNSSGNGGLKAFYTGLAQDAPKSVLDSFLFFLFYEWFRSLRLRSRRRSARGQGRGLGMMEEIAVGMAAGACSRSFTTPISNIVTRKQTATLLDAERPASVGDIVRSIREEKGIAGFWAGYSATLLLTLNPSLTFFLQEFLKSTFADTRYDDPGSRLTFLFAATSKAMSSFVTYPFQTAKTRMQSGVPVDTGAKNGSDDSDEKREGTAEETGTQPKALRTVKNVARKSVFGTVAHIVRSEGIASLYDGVGAELLKGFFSHGTTMVAKDIVHKLLFKLYLVVVGILAELRRRRLSTTTAESQMLPRALQYRINASLRSGKTTRKMPDYTTNVVANLIDGTQRPFRKR